MDHIERERRTVETMIRLYCRRKEGNEELCQGCGSLIEYAGERLSRCRFGNAKPSCRRCAVHCYRRAEREKIREVMRWVGPRMIFCHPMMAIRHILA